MGNSFDRKIRRKKSREKTKQNNKDLQEKLGLFDSLSESCLVCQTPFDKTNKDMVMSWNVVVRSEEQKVNLYCPECWNSALKTINDFRKHVEEKNKDNDN